MKNENPIFGNFKKGNQMVKNYKSYVKMYNQMAHVHYFLLQKWYYLNIPQFWLCDVHPNKLQSSRNTPLNGCKLCNDVSCQWQRPINILEQLQIQTNQIKNTHYISIFVPQQITARESERKESTINI